MIGATQDLLSLNAALAITRQGNVLVRSDTSSLLSLSATRQTATVPSTAGSAEVATAFGSGFDLYADVSALGAVDAAVGVNVTGDGVAVEASADVDLS